MTNEKTQEIVGVKPTNPEKHKSHVGIVGPLTPEYLISQGIQNNISVETVKELLAMRKELKAEYAKAKFDEAMANFQSECPIIKKKKAGGKTKTGIVAYHYAPLDEIVSQTKELISKNGLSYAIKTETANGNIKSTCIVKHKDGHSEQSEMEVPLGVKTEIMSVPQLYASVSTFTKRYAFCNAFGIMTGDNDDDGNAKVKEVKQYTVAEIIANIRKDKKEKMTKWRTWVEKQNYNDKQKDLILRTIEEKENATE